MTNHNIFWIKPKIVPASYLVSIWRETFHQHKAVQTKAKLLYPSGVGLKNEPLLQRQIKHIFEEVFAFVPYECSQTLQELLDEGKPHGVTVDDFKLLRKSADRTYAILREKPNINPSLDVTIMSDNEEPVHNSEGEPSAIANSESGETPSYLVDDTRLVQVATKMGGTKMRAQLAPELKHDTLYPARNDTLLRTFCAQLRRARDNGWFKDAPDDSDELLILSAINKSNRQDLLQSMTQEQYADVEAFIEFLKACEGRTREDLRNDLRDFRQTPNEPQHLLLGRLINLYSELREWTEIPSLETLDAEKKFEFDCNELISHMIEGQLDTRVTALLKQHRPELSIKTIADVAKRFAASLPRTTSVNNAMVQNEKLTSLENQLKTLSVNLAKFGDKKKSRKGQFKGTCNACEMKGHKKAQCWYANEALRPKNWKPKAETLKKVNEKKSKKSD